MQRIEAIEQIRQDPNFGVLAGSYKRVRNIIKDNRETTVKSELFDHTAEKQLHRLFVEVQEEMGRLVENRDYGAALQAMLRMKEPVDTFFDEVMVMAEDEAVRQNRLNLLTALGDLILQIGDISKLQEG